MTTEKLAQSLDNGYQFDIGAYIRKGFNIFQKKPVLFIGFALVAGMITTFAQMVPFIGFIATALVSYPLTAGYYIAARQLDKGNEITFSTFFEGFEYFGNLVAIYLIQVLAIIALLLPFGFSIGISALMGAASGSEWTLAAVSSISVVLLLVMMVPVIYLYVSWMFAPHLVVFHGLGFWEAMETSRKLVQKRWWIVFAFALCLALVFLGGVLALVIGLLVAVPVISLSSYAAFGDVAGFVDQGSPQDTITDHLVE